MPPAATKKGGKCTAPLDACKTPPGPPAPYLNTSKLTGATSTASTVLIGNKETVVQSSKIPMSTGDEAGTLLGVKSQTILSQTAFLTYSSTVYAEGKKIVYHGAVTAQNGANANIIGFHSSPSQSTVIVAS